MIKVTIVLRSLLKNKIGKDEIEINLPEKSNVTNLAFELGKLFGDEVSDFIIDKKSSTIIAMFSCKKERCTKDHVLKDGDVVSIFPAISGG